MNRTGIERVAVIGAGLMGHGIAQVFATAGYRVALCDQSDDVLRRAMAGIEGSLRMLAGLGAIQEDRVPSIVERITPLGDLRTAVAQADLVVESVSEDLALKREVFHQLDAYSPEHSVLCSNSSSIMPSQLAGATRRPQSVAGLHFFNPAALVPLVEVIPSALTEGRVTGMLLAVMEKAGRKPVVLQREVPGFLANRLQAALVREAVHLVSSGVATAEDIDNTVRYGLSQRWSAAGVLALLDLAGLDTALAASALILPDLDSSVDADALRQMVARGELGAKSGRGWHTWTTDRLESAKRRIAAALLNSSAQ